MESFSRKLLIKSRNQTIYEKFKLNRNLQRIPFKMMYNMSMLRHRLSNERRGGGGGALNHLPLLFCESVYLVKKHDQRQEKCHFSEKFLYELKFEIKSPNLSPTRNLSQIYRKTIKHDRAFCYCVS